MRTRLIQFYIGCSACPDSKAFAKTGMHFNEMVMRRDMVQPALTVVDGLMTL